MVALAATGDPMDGKVKTGTLVEHPKRPAWGPGKVVQITSSFLFVVFRDLPDREARRFRLSDSMLAVAASQSDPLLDNLPPLVQEGEKWVLPAPRMTLGMAVERFGARFPGGLSDPAYLESERDYKWSAHERWIKDLGNGQAETLLAQNRLEELTRRALGVIQRTNHLASYESMALRDGLSHEPSARRFFERLVALLSSKEIAASVWKPFAAAVGELPRAEGKARVLTWPNVTILPFLAQPDRHMLLKPNTTKVAAETLGFDLKYEPTPNWPTYEALLRMGDVYRGLLQFLAPRDMIDVQSFIWVTCGGYDHVPLAEE
jgi:hypothetical protein